MRFSLVSALLFSLAAADTLTVTIFANDNCTDPIQYYTIGNIAECHNTQTFGSIRQSHIATSFFKRGLRILTYSEPDCKGVPFETELSNNLVCDAPMPGQVSFIVATQV
ncbi:hypothetical protein F5884DRAFT_853831 [Xylogone sp. PMI_703]|nr:hypothetical protein F5884DRAFT_853831 [Xylogone sp. PMI_703]